MTPVGWLISAISFMLGFYMAWRLQAKRNIKALNRLANQLKPRFRGNKDIE